MKLIKKFVIVGIMFVIVSSFTTNEVKADDIPNAELYTVDLVVFAGQSNMSGFGGDVFKASSVPNGHGFEFRNGKDPAGMYGVIEPFGDRSNGYLSDPEEARKGSLVSSFMNTYYNTTGIPVLGVSASRGGAGMKEFFLQPYVQSDLINKYQAAKDWCGANNVKIRKQYVVWLQGETDALHGVDPREYMESVQKLFTPLFNSGLQQVFIITPGNFEAAPGIFDNIIEAQRALAIKDARFTLASDALRTLPLTYLVDGIHYNQDALNLVGAQAATSAAAYSAVSP